MTKKSTYFHLILLLLFNLHQACAKTTEKPEADQPHAKDEIWKIKEANYALEIRIIDSLQYYKAKQASKGQAQKMLKITDLNTVRKLLKGVVEFKEHEFNTGVKKITFKNGTVWQSQHDEEIFVAYYPDEDIILLEGGHNSDISFNLKNGQEIEETGNPDHIVTSPSNQIRLNGFYDGQECTTYFIQKNQNGLFVKIIPLSDALKKVEKINLCRANETFWTDDNTLFIRDDYAYDKDGNQRTKFYRITIINADALSSARQSSKKSVDDFIPKGWIEILRETGDLNSDGIDDLALVIEDTKPGNFRKNDGLGMPELNLNPRTLLILFKNKSGGYELGGKNDRGLIETQSSEMNPCLSDPLLQDGDLTLTKGLLKISFNYWLSCGSYYVNNAAYTFRFQHNRFELIGFDASDYNRASGEKNASSINFLTKKKSTTSGGNMFDDEASKPVTTWKNIAVKRLYTLEELDQETFFDY